jgi:hypothetical protein
MERKIYLNEQQLRMLVENQMLMESMFKGVKNFKDLVKLVKSLALKGILTASLVSNICMYYKLNNEQSQVIEDIAQETEKVNSNDTIESETIDKKAKDKGPWALACDEVIATVYNAVPEQCNADCGRTATMFRLNLSDPYSHRIIAIERTMMNKYDIQMGDVVYLKGVGEYDGVWQVQDKMNKRFANKKKIDLLVNGDVKYGKWDDVQIYTLKDKSQTETYKSQLAPQLTKAEFNAQFNNIG